MSRTIGGFGLKGIGALIVALVVLAALLYYARSFVVIIIAAAVVAVVILHFVNQRPVKLPEDDQIRLNLDKDK
jgi:O-antigen ligase